MKQQVTRGIVLSRTDYGEADRIVTILTPDQGKLRVMARGVRKMKSKLAGGIELFSVSDITYIGGRGSLHTLISARLQQHYDNIVTDITRVQLGYELLQMLNKATEDEPESDYFELLNQGLAALNTPGVDTQLIRLWFESQLLRLAGHSPNLHTDAHGKKLDSETKYTFDFDSMAFAEHPTAQFHAGHIKVMRLLFSHHQPHVISQVQDIVEALHDIAPLVRTMRSTSVGV